MCGILGTVAGAEGMAAELPLGMLRHRGPDSSGQWRSGCGRVWLGHTRLAILDLSACGAQPMRDEGSGNVMVFNGEIYNHLELRRELEAAGVRFRGHSDTETLLAGYTAWGVEVFFRARGMFAVAVYDARMGGVVLARDALGIKPLYWRREEGGGVAFASEVRPLVSGGRGRVSLEGMAAYLRYGCCPHERLLFEGVYEFPAGAWAVVRPGREPVFRRHWPAPGGAGSAGVEERGDEVARGGAGEPRSAARRVRALLEAAVASHLQSDVPVACFLSGGIDSSIIAALAAGRVRERQAGGRLATFSVGFDQAAFDESQFARQLAERYETEHHHIHLDERERRELVTAAVGAMDLPTVDGANTYIVSSRVAREGFKVVLSGLGADEIFGGYPMFREFAFIHLVASAPEAVRRLALRLGKGRHLFSDRPRSLDGEDLSVWWRRVWNGELLGRFGLRCPEFGREPRPALRDAMAEFSWGELSHYMRDMLLRDSDAMSMAHSLELRVPFLDLGLVEEVLGLPAGVKFDRRIPKRLLIEAAGDLIPEDIWNRPKMGFELPMRSWMTGALREFSLEGLKLLSRRTGLEEKGLEGLWREFVEGRARWQQPWAAVVLGHYLERVAGAAVREGGRV